MLNVSKVLSVETWGEHSYVVNPATPDRLYHTREVVRVVDANGKPGALSVRLEEIDPETEYKVREDIIVELNMFVNKFNEYVKPNVVKPAENEQEQ